MKVFEVVLNELKGVFGKTYLLAGLLPALMCILIWAWYVSERSPAALLADVARAFTAESTQDLVSAGLGSLGLGLALFAARSQLRFFMEEFPCGPLRGWLVRRQVRRRLEAEIDTAEQDHRLTLAKWIGTEEDFSRPIYLPPRESVLDTANMASDSAAALALSRSLCVDWPKAVRPLRDSDAETLYKGLRALYAVARHDGAACTEQIQAWRGQLRPPVGAEVVKMIAATAHRDWERSQIRLDAYPPAEQLRPTRLGTVGAVLNDYAKSRYGIDTSVLLARLWGILDKEEQASLAESQLSVEVLLNLSAAMVLSALAVAASAAIKAFHPGPAATFPSPGQVFRAAVFIFAAGVFTWTFYRAAVLAYHSFNEKVKRAVDLRRLDLIDRLGFPRPRDVREELELWSALALFFEERQPLDPDLPIVSRNESSTSH